MQINNSQESKPSRTSRKVSSKQADAKKSLGEAGVAEPRIKKERAAFKEREERHSPAWPAKLLSSPRKR